jgi:hypothetical protein
MTSPADWVSRSSGIGTCTVADLVAVVMALAVSDTASDSLADGDV